MEWNENFTILNYLLADLYSDRAESREVAKKTGMNTGLIAFKDQPYSNWFNILEEGIKQAKIIDLLKKIITPPERGSYDPSVKQSIEGIIANLQNNQAPVKNIPEPAGANADQLSGQLEKIMGSASTLLPISFLEQGLINSKAVVRIECSGELGSGFLIGGNWIITNNHVIYSAANAQKAKFQFNYQKSLAGNDMVFEEFESDGGQNDFYTSVEDDWSFIKLNSDANAKYGALKLSDKAVEANDFVNIIQHPGGGPKQIALYHNNVTSVDDKYVLYLTDTMNGSSGSPVFNTNWEVVALHHWGGTTKEAFSNLNVYRNRGITITRVRKALSNHNII